MRDGRRPAKSLIYKDFSDFHVTFARATMRMRDFHVTICVAYVCNMRMTCHLCVDPALAGRFPAYELVKRNPLTRSTLAGCIVS